MKFQLTITLGNAAMQTGFDVANALRLVADQQERYGNDELVEGDTGRIRDLNGNTAGDWEVTK